MWQTMTAQQQDGRTAYNRAQDDLDGALDDCGYLLGVLSEALDAAFNGTKEIPFSLQNLQGAFSVLHERLMAAKTARDVLYRDRRSTG